MTVTISAAFSADPTLPAPGPQPQPGQVLGDGSFAQTAGAVLTLRTGEGVSLGSVTLTQASGGIDRIVEMPDGNLLVLSSVIDTGPGGEVHVPWQTLIDPDTATGPAVVAGPDLLGLARFPGMVWPLAGGGFLLLGQSIGPFPSQALYHYDASLTQVGPPLFGWSDSHLLGFDQFALLPGGNIALISESSGPDFTLDVITPTGGFVGTLGPFADRPLLIATGDGFALIRLPASGGDVTMQRYGTTGALIATQNVSDPLGGAAGVASLGQALMLPDGTIAVTWQPVGSTGWVLRRIDPGLPPGVNSNLPGFAVNDDSLLLDPSGLLTVGASAALPLWFRPDTILTSDGAGDLMAGTAAIETFRGNGGIDTVDYSATRIGGGGRSAAGPRLWPDLERLGFRPLHGYRERHRQPDVGPDHRQRREQPAERHGWQRHLAGRQRPRQPDGWRGQRRAGRRHRQRHAGRRRGQ